MGNAIPDARDSSSLSSSSALSDKLVAEYGLSCVFPAAAQCCRIAFGGAPRRLANAD